MATAGAGAAFSRALGWHVLCQLACILYCAVALFEPTQQNVGLVGLPLHIGGLILRLSVHRWHDQQEACHIFIFILIAFCFVPVTAIWMQAQSQAPKPRLKPP